MKVLDLQCVQQHRFEGWFASEDEFQRQLQAGLLECPLCGATSVSKCLSAPRLNLGSGRASSAEPAEPVVVASPEPAVQAQWLSALRHLVASTEDVGEKFPEEARRIHYGEVRERSIRGEANATQRRELLDEGIMVMPLPKMLKDPLH